MLVLSRLRGESVRITVSNADLCALATSGEDLTITAMPVDIRGVKARIGFHAPREVVIHREEVYQRIEADAAAA